LKPDELAEQLLASPAGAVKAIAVLERMGFSEEEQAAKETRLPPAIGHDTRAIVEGLSELGLVAPMTGLAEAVARAYRTGQAQRLGLPMTAEELAALVASGEGADVDGDRRNVAPVGDPSSVPPSEGPPTSDFGSREPYAPQKISNQGDPTTASVRRWREEQGLPTGADVYGDGPPPQRPASSIEAIRLAHGAATRLDA
jgi:hypothetical protein